MDALHGLQQLTGLFSAATQVAGVAQQWGVTDAVVGMSTGPAGMGLIAAKWLLSSSLTSSVGAFGASWVAKWLLSQYGEDIARGLYQTISTEMGKLPQQSYWGGPAPQPPPASHLSLEGALSMIDTAAKHSRALSILLLFLSVQYLHALGAYEMRRAVRARADARSRIIIPAASPSSSTTAPLKTGADEATRRAYFQARASETAPRTQATMKVEALDRRVAQEDAGIFDRLLHSLYASHSFYAPAGSKDVETAYFTLSSNHPVRVLVNLLLGFMMQMNALLLPFRNKNQNGTHDPIADVARAASVVAYFELLMRSLRLYGWAPVYVATSLVARQLFAAAGRKRNI
jgi:hypothetical protein